MTRGLKKVGLVILLVASFAPLILAPVQPAFGATLTVTRTGDPPPNGCKPNDCSLREAIIASNNRPGPDTITLSTGRYELNRPTADEDFADTGDLDIRKPVTIRGAGRTRTIIDANSHDRVLHILDDVDDVLLSNLALVGGNTPGGAGVFNLGELKLRKALVRNNDGGGINNQHRLRIVHSRVTENFNGRGIDNVGRLTVKNSRIDHNEFSCCGVGISNVAGARATIVGSRIDHNRGSSCCGIGIYAQDEAVLTLKRTTVSGNRGQSCCGGGIYLEDNSVGRIVNSRVTNNRLPLSCCGSGIYLQDSSFVSIKGTLVRNNVQKSSGPGGAVYSEDAGLIIMRNSTITANTAEAEGGGLYLKDASDLVLVNSTVSGNSALAGGGLAEVSTASLSLTHVTMTRNESENPGGGISTDGGSWTVLRSIVAGNSDEDCNMTLVGPTGKNLDKDSTCFNTGIPIHAGPRLRALDDNGGKTPTHLPQRTSPAVDEVGGANCGEPGRDQRGVKRPQNGDGQPGKTCDLGAVERKPGE